VSHVAAAEAAAVTFTAAGAGCCCHAHLCVWLVLTRAVLLRAGADSKALGSSMSPPAAWVHPIICGVRSRVTAAAALQGGCSTGSVLRWWVACSCGLHVGWRCHIWLLRRACAYSADCCAFVCVRPTSLAHGRGACLPCLGLLYHMWWFDRKARGSHRGHPRVTTLH
jgi:hypothetical protein